MNHEIIIAADKVKAETYAMERGWQPQDGERATYVRFQSALTLLNGEAAEAMKDKLIHGTSRPPQLDLTIPVRFVGTPMALDALPAGTPVHVASFPGGIPAVWAKALSRHSVITDISDKRIGGYKPMCSAPQDRDILIFDALSMRWHEATFQRGQWYSATGNAYVIEEAVCWVERPENPPEIMIRRAKVAQ